jgi:hypothetical protein
LQATGRVFEIFGGEGLLRPAMHYRWNFDEDNLAFLTSEFGLMAPAAVAIEEAEKGFLHNSGRMRKAAVNFGVTPETGPTIEAAFHEWLDLFSATRLRQRSSSGAPHGSGDGSSACPPTSRTYTSTTTRPTI